MTIALDYFFMLMIIAAIETLDWMLIHLWHR